MARARRNGAEDSVARTAILDAAEQLMLEEGYGAVTSRRVAMRAGVHAALIYYYFGPMDGLFVAVFRRRAEWMLERHAEALSSEQPLWALWDVLRDKNGALHLEFLALGNHRKAVGAEISSYAKKFRHMHLESLSTALGGYGVDGKSWPPVAVVVFLSSIARFLLMEQEAYDLDLGHAEAIEIVERHIRELEGERRSRASRSRARGSG